MSFLMAKQDFLREGCTALGQMPREAVGSPPMEILRTQINKALSKLS